MAVCIFRQLFEDIYCLFRSLFALKNRNISYLIYMLARLLFDVKGLQLVFQRNKKQTKQAFRII